MIRAKEQKGFTVLELLTILAIMGILAMIVCRQISVYKSRAFDALAEQDLHAALTAEEAYYSANEQYVGCADEECETALKNFTLSNGTKITMEVLDDGWGYSGVAYHPRGGKTFRFDSLSDGVITAS